MRGAEGAEAISNLYIGSSFELEGRAGQTATKQTKHIFMGSTRICSVETNLALASTSTFYYHQDHLGSSNIITDETGVVVNILEYTPYGEVSRNTGNYSTDKRFTGKIWDESSALSYYGARYYDPELGRFITADPTIQRPYDPQDFNRYAYARNNPVKYVDPTGLGFWDWLVSFIAGFVGAVVAVVVSFYAGPIAGGAIGGAVSGAIIGGYYGGWEGALKGAAIGFVMGAAMGAGYGIANAAGYGGAYLAATAIGGAVYAGVSGGGEGLASYAAGTIGGFYGYSLGNALIGQSTVRSPNRNSSDASSQAEQSRTKADIHVDKAINNAQLTRANDSASSLSAIPAQGRAEVAARIAQAAQRGDIGTGSKIGNPHTKQAGVNWKTVGIGITEVILGIGTIVGSVVGGAAATTASGGAAAVYAAMGTGSGISIGYGVAALGVGEIISGFYGYESMSVDVIRSFYNTPSIVDEFDVF